MEKLMELQSGGKRTVLRLLKNNLLADDNENFKEEFDAAFPALSEETALDFEEVDYISSLILASMMYILKRLCESRKKLVLIHIQPKVQTMLRMTNLDKIFDIE
jgi:anti-anti-sigma factor